MWELTANNFHRRNCVDLKPVPIIRFIFQFGFRIVWDSDPSGFGILKCPSLASSHSNYVVYTASCRGTKVSYRIWLCSHSSWCFLKQPTSFGARPHQQFVGCAAEISATYDWNCRGHTRNVPSNPCYSKWLSGLKIFVVAWTQSWGGTSWFSNAGPHFWGSFISECRRVWFAASCNWQQG